MDSPKTSPEKVSGDAPNKKPASRRYAFSCAILSSMTSILLGYDIAVMSGAAMFIKDDLHISDTQLEILAGIINIYSLLGSIAAGRTSDWLGRRYTMVLAASIFFLGALLMGLATNYPFLMFGRFVAGIGVGYALMIAPVYTAELSPSSSRGALSSLPEIFINAGVLLGYISNFALSPLPRSLNWRIMFLLGAIPPLFLIAAVLLLMPESPRWLVMKGRCDEAAKILDKISDSSDESAARLREILSAAADSDGSNRGFELWKELIVRPSPVVRRIILAALGLQFFQQGSGIDSVVLYSPRIFEKAGIRSKNGKLGATVAVGFTKTSFILIATFLLDRVGRRVLLLCSGGGMIVSLLGLGTAMVVIERDRGASKGMVGVSIGAVMMFVGSFSMGVGPIAWVYCSEIFPLRMRAAGASMGTGMNRVMSGVVAMTFITMYERIGIGGSFYVYAGVATCGWLFFYACLPETRGRSLEDMEEVFGGKKKEVEIVAGNV